MRKAIPFLLLFFLICFAVPPGPTANMFVPKNGGWAGCDFQTIRIAITDINNDEVDTTTIQLRVNGILYLWHDSHLDWSDDSVLIFTPTSAFSASETVRVVLEQANTMDGLPLQAGSYSYEFYMDFDYPFFLPETRYPPPGTTVCADVGSIAVKVMDTTSGIPYDGLCMCVNANHYTCSPNRSDGYCWQPSLDTQFVYVDSTFYIKWNYFTSFDDEDSITACLHKAVDYVTNDYADSLICGPHWFDTTDVQQCWTFIKDCIGPRAYLIFPGIDDTTACDSIVIGFIDFSGVDTMLIKMSITGIFPFPQVNVSPDFNASSDGDTAYFVGTLGEGNISMRLMQVRDKAGNTSSTSSFPIWSIYVDKSAPVASSPLPPDGSTAGSSTPSVSIAVSDVYTAPEPNSMELEIDGVHYNYPHPALSWDGSRLTFSSSVAGVSFSDGDTVDVCLNSACDIVPSDKCGPNCITTPFCWSFTIDQGGPRAELISPPDSIYTACADQNIILHIWDPSGVNPLSIVLGVEGTTYDSLDNMIYSNDTLIFTPPSNWTNGQEIDWALTAADDIIGNPLATPISGIFYVDLLPPFVTNIQPFAGTRFGPSYLTAIWTLIDPQAGVDPTTAIVSVQGNNYPYPAGFSWDSSDLDFNLAFTSLSFSDGETVQVCLHIGDSITAQFCGPNWRDTCTYFIADLAGPVADMIYPPESTITACANGEIKIYTSDIDGIEQSSVQLNIDGTTYFDASPEISWSDDTIIFTPSTPFSHNDTVNVRLTMLSDTLGNNISSSFDWVFYIDIEPPQLTAYNPPNDGEVSNTSPTIRFWLDDVPAGVDTTTITIRIDGAEYNVGSPGCAWSGGQIIFDCAGAGLSFGDGDTVDVCFVSASDLVNSSLCGPNTTNPDSCWFFRIDLSGPTTDLILPLDGSYTSCANQEIWVYLYDDQGIFPESTAVRVNDDTLYAWLGELTTHGDTAIYSPAVPFTDGEIVNVQVVHATDSLGNTMTGGDIWTFIVDLNPPTWISTDPSPASFVASGSPTISIAFVDSVSGVNPTSLNITIEGSPYVGMLPGINWVDPAFDIELAMLGYSFGNGDTIDFCFNSLGDLSAYCGSNDLAPDSCWQYFVDLIGPSADIIYPADSSFFGCPSGTLVVLLYDNFGIVESTVTLNISSVPYTITSPQMWINDDTIYFIPSAGWTDGDTIIVQVSSAEDFAGNPITSGGPWQFYIDFSGPQIISANPPSGSILSNPTPTISADIQDDGAGIDGGSIDVFVDGSPVTTGVSYSAGTITVDFAAAGLSYSSGDTIAVCYGGDDLVLSQYCGPNSGDTACFQYIFDTNGPTASVIEPVPGNYTTCSDQNILIRLVDDFGVNNSSIHLRVNGMNYTLTDSNLTYIGDSLLQFYPPDSLPEGENFVTLWGVADGSGNVLASDSLTFSFFVDYTPPYITSTLPLPGTVVPDSEIIIQVGLADDGSGVKDSSITFTVNGAVFTLADGCLGWDGSTATLTLAACGILFSDGDTIRACVRASDNPDYCSPNNMSDSCWSFLISFEGPAVEILAPTDWQTSACDDQPIFVQITDGNGIDESSIQMIVDGSTYTTANPELSFYNDTLRFIPSTNWTDGETVSVTLVSANDVVGTPSSDTPISWSFIIDLSPPYVSGVHPPAGTSFSTGDADIAVTLTDDISGANPYTIRVQIGAYMFTYPAGDMTYDGDTLYFSLSGLGIIPLDGDSLTICVQNTQDNPDYCDPNTMTPYCFSYYFDYRGPQVNLMFPPESVYVSCIDSSIIWTVWDAAGIDSPSVLVNIDGTTIDLTSPHLSLSGTYLIFNPDTTFTEGVMFPVEIVSVDDGVGNTTGPLTWWVGFDTTGPVLSDPDPADGGVASIATPVISVAIDDNASGVYPYWARMIINDTDTIHAVVGDMSWDGLRLSADLEALGIFLPGGETTTVCIDSVFDNAYACGRNLSEQFCWNFRVDEGGPIPILISPPDGAISSCDDDTIKILLRDNNGVDWVSTSLSVDGVEYPVTVAPCLILDDSTLAFVPSIPFSDGDTVEFFISESADTFGHTSSTLPHWQIVIDTSPPYPYLLEPTAGEFIDDDWLCVLHDNIAGIDTESIDVTVNAFSATYTLDIDSVILDLSIFSFSDTDSVEICITVDDLVNWCPPNELDECYHYYIDRTEPSASLISPFAGAISACDDQTAEWIIQDYFGIDNATILVEYNGDTIGIDDPRLTISGDTLIFTPIGLSDGDTVRATLISASDNAGNTASIGSSVWYVIDLSPPIFTGSMPVDSSSVGDPSPTIRIYLDDEIAGVNAGSISITVDGSPVLPAWDGSAAVIDCSALGIIFDDGDTVQVCFSAADMPDLCPANTMAETCIVFFINLSGPMANIIEPMPNSYIACDDGEQHILMTIFDTDGVDDSSISFVINGDTIDLASPELNYSNDTLTYIPSTAWVDGETVHCVLNSVQDSIGNVLASPIEWNFIVDLSPPEFTSPIPAIGSTVPNLTGGISLSISDIGSGVNDSSIQIWIVGGTDTFTLSTGLVWDGIDANIPESLLSSLSSGLINICAAASDLPDYCAANSDTFCWNFTLSGEGPSADAISPLPMQIISCDEGEQQISIYLHSDDGIDMDSIDLQVNHISVSGTYVNDTLTYIPSASWADGETVFVHLDAEDIYGVSLSAPLEYWFVVDMTAPVFDFGSMTFFPTGSVNIGLSDTIAGVDTSSVEAYIWTNSAPADTFIPSITYSDDTLHLDILSAHPYFRFGDTVNFCISAGDLAQICGANEAFVCTSAVIEPISILMPFDGAITSCDDQSISVVLPVPAGLNDFLVIVNDDSIGAIDVELFGDTVLYTPTTLYFSGEIVNVEIVSAFDVSGLEIHCDNVFRFTIDLDPPVVIPISPAPGSGIVEPSPIISAILSDSIAGVNSSTIQIILNGTDTFTIDSAAVDYSDDTLDLDCMVAGLTFANDETVQVCIAAVDSPDYCEPNAMPAPYCWLFYVSFEGPSAELEFPTIGSSVACEDTAIVIFLDDEDGINESSIEFEVDGITYTTDSAGLSFSGDTLYYSIGSTYDGDTVHFSLVEASDSDGNLLAAPLTGWFIFDLAPPYLDSWSPLTTTETSPTIWFVLIDSVSGIDWTSLNVVIGSSVFDTSSPALTISGDTVYFDCSIAGIVFDVGDTSIFFSVSDQPDFCGSHSLDTFFVITILPSGDGPIANLIQPDSGSVISCDGGNIAFVVQGPYDILEDSLGLVIGDTLRLVNAYTPPGLTVSAVGDTVRFNFPGTFANGDTVQFSPIGYDEFFTPVASVEWFFVIDLEPPINTLIQPISQTTNSLAPIEIGILDNIAGVLSDSIFITIITPRGNWQFTVDSLGANWDGSTFTIAPDVVNGSAPWTPIDDSTLLYFHENETLYVSVQSCDSAQLCGANCSDDTLMFYTNDDDTIPPDLIGWAPESVYAGTDFDLSIYVSDSSGLGPCCFAIVDGETLSVVIIPDGDSFIVNILGLTAPAPDETLWIQINLCDDDFDFENIEDRIDTFYNIPIISIAGQGPVVRFIQPLDSEYISCADGPIIALVSDSDGVNTLSVVFVEGIDTLPIIWNGDTVNISPLTPWSNGDIVNISLIHSEDIIGNIGDTTEITFTVDLTPPEISLISPDTGIIDGDETARFDILDSLSGVGEIYGIIGSDTILLDVDNPSISLAGYGAFSETLNIEIYACDNALYCGANCDSANFWFIPAPQTHCDAYPIPFTPNNDGVNDYIYFDYPDMVKDGATVSILTVDGMMVRKIDLSPSLPRTTALWDGTNDNGDPLPPGIYIYVVSRDGRVLCKGSIALAR